MRLPFSNANRILQYDYNVSYVSQYSQKSITYTLNIKQLLGTSDIEQAFFKVLVRDADEYSYSGICKNDIFYMFDLNDSSLVATCSSPKDEPNYLLFDVTSLIKKYIKNNQETVNVYMIRHTDDSNSIVNYSFIDYSDSKYKTFYGNLIKNEKSLVEGNINKIETPCGTLLKNLTDENIILKLPDICVEENISSINITGGFNNHDETILLSNKKLKFNYNYYVYLSANRIYLYDYLGNEKEYFASNLSWLNKEYHSKITSNEFCFNNSDLNYNNGQKQVSSIYYNYNDLSYIYYDNNENILYLSDSNKNKTIIKLTSIEDNDVVNYYGKILYKVSNKMYFYKFIWSDDNYLIEIQNNKSRPVVKFYYNSNNNMGIHLLTNNLYYEFIYDNYLLLNKVDVYIVKLGSIFNEHKDLLNSYNFIFNDEQKIIKIVDLNKKNGVLIDYLGESSTKISKVFIDDYNSIIEDYNLYTYDIENNIVTITDRFDKYINIYLDQNGEIKFVIDDKSNYFLNKRILYKNDEYFLLKNLIDCNERENIIANGNFDSAINDVSGEIEQDTGLWTIPNTISYEIVEDNYLSEIIGTKGIKFNNIFYPTNYVDRLLNCMYQIIDCNLLQGQSYGLEIWGKSDGEAGSNVVVSIEIIDQVMLKDQKIQFSLNFSSNNYENYICQFICPTSTTKLIVYLTHLGPSSAVIKNIRMYPLGSLSIHSSHMLEEEYTRDEYNKVSYIRKDNNIIEFKYDEYNRLCQTINHTTGLNTYYSYDSNNYNPPSNNIIYVQTVDEFGNIINVQTPYMNYNLLKSYSDENNYKEVYNYDSKLNKIEVIDNSGICNHKKYNEFNKLAFEETIINNYKDFVNYNYDDNQNLNNIKINDEYQFSYNYDENKLTSESYSNIDDLNEEIVLNEFSYDSIIEDVDSSSDKSKYKLSNHKNYLTNHQNKYLYNTNGTLSRIYTKSIDSPDEEYEEIERYTYYNNDRIKRIRHILFGNNRTTFEYNDLLNLKTKMVEQDGEYFVIQEYLNDEGILRKKQYRISDYFESNSYCDCLTINTNFNKIDNINLTSKLQQFSQHFLNDYILGSMKKPFYTSKLLIDNVDIMYDSTIKSPILLFNKYTSTLIYEINKLNKNRNHGQYYGGKKYDSSVHNVKLGFNCILMFKINQEKTQQRMLFSVANENYTIGIKYSSGSLYLMKKNMNNTVIEKICDFPQSNNWHILQLGTSASSANNYQIGINIDPTENLGLGDNYKYVFEGINFAPTHVSIGDAYVNGATSSYYTNNEMSNTFTEYKVAYFSIGNDNVLYEDLKLLYKEITSIINSPTEEVHTSTTYSVFDGSFDVIDFNNNLVSLNGTYPSTLSYTYCYDNNNISRLFEYDNELERYVYRSTFEIGDYFATRFSCLGYKLGFEETGSFGLRFNVTSDGYLLSNFLRKIFSHDSSKYYDDLFNLYFNGSKLLIEYGRGYSSITNAYSPSNLNELNTIDTGITISKNQWHTLYCDFSPNSTKTKIKIKLDNQEIELDLPCTIDLTDCETLIGCGKDNYLCLCGQIDGKFDVFMYENKINNEICNQLLMYDPAYTKNYYSSNGRKTKKVVYIPGKKYTTSYNYFEKNSVLRKLPDCVEDYNGNKVYYGYDNINNITNIVKMNNGQEVESNSFEYNILKQLSREVYKDNNNYLQYQYIYTNNGNIDKVIKTDLNSDNTVEYQYEYDQNIPNQLKKVTNTTEQSILYTLNYDENYPLRLTSYTKNDTTYNITYKGNYIKSIGNIEFNYDEAGNRIEKITPEKTIYYHFDQNKLVSTLDSSTNIKTLYLYDEENNLIGLYLQNNYYLYEKDLTGNIIGIIDSTNTLLVKYIYNGFGVRQSIIPNNLTTEQQQIAPLLINNNHLSYKGYIYDVETNLFLVTSRYYSPELGRFIQPADVSTLNPSSINGLNLYSYANNNPISFSYNNSSAIGSTSVGGGLVSSIGAGSLFAGNRNPNSTSKGGLNLGWIANKLDAGSTLHGLYSSASTIYNNISYFSKNLHAFSDDMTMLGASMKDGVLAFNQFSWGLGKSDIFGVALGVGLDIYDSVQRGVSPGGVVLGATLTAAKGVGLIYLNKGILYGATALGSAICPGVGTVVGFVVGGVVCVFVDIFVSNWLDALIDSIAK